MFRGELAVGLVIGVNPRSLMKFSPGFGLARPCHRFCGDHQRLSVIAQDCLVHGQPGVLKEMSERFEGIKIKRSQPSAAPTGLCFFRCRGGVGR